MQPIALDDLVVLEEVLDRYAGGTWYLHLETTAGAYTANGYGAFVRNVRVQVRKLAVRSGGDRLRVGAQTEEGFVYAEGVTHWEVDGRGRLLLEGHDAEGRLTVIFALSPEPFPTAGEPRVVAPRLRRDHSRGLAPPSPERSVLCVFAHPDDETFGMGGTIALYAQAGIPVACATATLGEMGRNVGQPPVATRETLREVRERELRDALDVLGVGDLWLLGVWDKTVEFRDPDALAEAVLQVLERVRPSLVLTSHPVYGGHPDHCAAGRAALRAVGRLPAGERPRVRCSVPPWLHERLGMPPQRVDISAVADIKLDAIRAHRSQSEGMLRRMAENPEAEDVRRRFRYEYYVEDPQLPDGTDR